jgi:hypothetical protein
MNLIFLGYITKKRELIDPKKSIIKEGSTHSNMQKISFNLKAVND